MPESEFVSLTVEDGVATVRLDRPKMNAINTQLHREIKAAALQAGADTDVRAVVLYGGERVFAAGMVISGASPVYAGIYQFIIVAMILAASGITGLTVVLLARGRVFSPAAQLILRRARISQS